MKKRRKITIKPKKPKIQIKGSKASSVPTYKDRIKVLKSYLDLRFSAIINFFQKRKVLGFSLLAMIPLVIIFFMVRSPEKEEINPEITAKVADDIKPKNGENVSDEISLSETLNRFQRYNNYQDSIQVLPSNILMSEQLKKEKLPDPIFNELVYLAKRKGISELQGKRSWYTISYVNRDGKGKSFIYELSPSQYYLINAIPKPEIILFSKSEEIKINTIAGVIKTNLWDAVRDNNGDTRIIEKMQTALGGVIDFYQVKPNDRFKLIYEEKWVEDKIVDVGELYAVYFQTQNKKYQAFHYKDQGTEGFFDQDGKSMKRKFLKSPVKYMQITSPYNPKRFHPVLKVVKPHRGTDFYARLGDPIFATADGKITKARYTTNNGYYIKIRHDRVYETQYLHLMKNGFAPGIKKGVHVKQGQIIGYAGKTGLTSGVHVCYRFWKNRKQVDPMLEDAVISDIPVLTDDSIFIQKRDTFIDMMEEVPFFELSSF